MTLHSTPAPIPKKMRKKRDTAPLTTAYSFGMLVCSFGGWKKEIRFENSVPL